MKLKRIAAVLTALALILGALPSAGLAVRAEGQRNEPGVEAESRPINEAPRRQGGPRGRRRPRGRNE